MKAYFLASVLLAALAIGIAVAYPSSEDGHQNKIAEENKVNIRTRRSMDGVFDAIANGMEGGLQGLKTVGNSIKAAFDSVFSTNNSNAISDGFNKFTNGIKNAFNNLFGEGGEKVKKGFKKIEDSVKKGLSPSGEVPEEETT